jgi:hypothetical protein
VPIDGNPREAGGTSGTSASDGANAGAAGSPYADWEEDPNDFPPCGELDPARTDCSALANISLDQAWLSTLRQGHLGYGQLGTLTVVITNGDAVVRDDVCVGLTVDQPNFGFGDPGSHDFADPMPIGAIGAGERALVTPFVVESLVPARAGTTATFPTWLGLVGTRCVAQRFDVLVDLEPVPDL